MQLIVKVLLIGFYMSLVECVKEIINKTKNTLLYLTVQKLIQLKVGLVNSSMVKQEQPLLNLKN
tara:strand:+ start:429 stop:620 length:192 start_codon:yes stop_codon:yes gene_type:complete